MKLIDHLKRLAPADRDAFAQRCETSIGHLNNVGYGYRPCGPELCVLIERESGGAVTRRDLRPDDWWRIWPELVTADHPAPEARQEAA